MKKFGCLLVLGLAAFTLQAADWKLVWSDEFDKPGLPDPAKWDYETGFVRNHEAQIYTRARQENARVEDGMLVIEARKERMKNPDFVPLASAMSSRGREYAEYTSASLRTLGKVSWTYGRIEVRAKLPSGKGVWPAIWTLGTNEMQVGWPACGEIDIMEFVGFEPGLIHANIHAKAANKGGQVTFADASTAFHNYALEWYPDRLDFFVDEQKYFTFTNDHTGVGAWPYEKDQYLILNLAIGGEWGGQKGIDDSIFPQKYYIDYVRVYQKAGQ